MPIREKLRIPYKDDYKFLEDHCEARRGSPLPVDIRRGRPRSLPQSLRRGQLEGDPNDLQIFRLSTPRIMNHDFTEAGYPHPDTSIEGTGQFEV